MYPNPMRRTQILLTPRQAASFRHAAAAEGRSIAELVRDAVDVWLGRRGMANREDVRHRSLAALGRYRSGVKDLGSEHDRYLVNAFGH